MSSRSSLYLAAVLFFGAVGIAHAQGPITSAKIPFDFVASGKTLPAGTYVFREALPDNQTQLAILDGKGDSALASATARDSQETGSKIVFRKYGDSYFLADIFSDSGRLHFAESRAEKKLAKTTNPQAIPIIAGE